MTKRIICLLLAVMIFAALPLAGAFADGESVTETIQTETLKQFCERMAQEKKIDKLDYDFSLPAIRILNHWVKGTDWVEGVDPDPVTMISVGDSIKLPKSNKDAALIRGVELPANLATGETQDYVIKAKDTMMGICKTLGLDYGKCKAAILKLNGWNDNNLLTMKAGTKIKLPKTDADAAIIAASGTTGTGTGTGIGGILTPADGTVAAHMVPYVVKTGETIYGICADNGVNFSKYVDLSMTVSGIKFATDLRVGNIVYLPSAKSATGAIAITAHTVKTGETTYGICQELGISYSARYNMITALNPGKNLDSIHTGDVLLFPAGGGTIPSGGGSVVPSGGGSSVVPSSSSSGYGGGYTPAAGKDSTTPAAVKPKEGVMYYLTEITIKKDDTAYALVKAAGFDYTTYYADVLLSFNNLSSFDNLKEGDKLLMVSSSATGAKYAVTGVKVKDGDTVTKMCADAGITYDNNVNLIAKLNPGVNINSIKTGDIIVLPKKLA